MTRPRPVTCLLGFLLAAAATPAAAFKCMPIYGNWCGVGYPNAGAPPPVDEFDAACMRHDFCIAGSGDSLPCDISFIQELHAVAARREVTPRGVFAHAAAVTALNPKSIAFFIAFVPQFLRPEAPLLGQFAILIATFVSLAALNALAYALLADRLRRTIGRPRVITGLTRTGGLALIGMGVATAILRRPTA